MTGDFFDQIGKSLMKSAKFRDGLGSGEGAGFRAPHDGQMKHAGVAGRLPRRAVEKLRERNHPAGTNGGAGAGQLIADVLRHGRRGSDEKRTVEAQKTLEREAGFSGRGRSGDQQ